MSPSMAIIARNESLTSRAGNLSVYNWHQNLLTKAGLLSRLKGREHEDRSCRRLRPRRCRRTRTHRTAPDRQADGRPVGVSRRQGGERRAAGANTDQGAQGGACHRRQRRLSRTTHFREPRLSGLSPSNAALCVPALGGNGHRHGRPAARLGETEPVAGLRDGSCGRAADLASDDAAVGPEENTMPPLYVQLRCFGFAREGTTAIEYSVIATGIAVALIAVINQLGTSVKALW